MTDSRDIRTWSILLQFESTRQKVGRLTFNAGERSRRYLARCPDAPCIWLLDKNGYLAAKDSIRFSWICIWIIKVRQNWGDSPANTGVLPSTMRGFKMVMMELQTMLGKHWIADMGLSRNVCFNRPIIKKKGGKTTEWWKFNYNGLWVGVRRWWTDLSAIVVTYCKQPCTTIKHRDADCTWLRYGMNQKWCSNHQKNTVVIYQEWTPDGILVEVWNFVTIKSGDIKLLRRTGGDHGKVFPNYPGTSNVT